jgi:hypothetical protein
MEEEGTDDPLNTAFIHDPYSSKPEGKGSVVVSKQERERFYPLGPPIRVLSNGKQLQVPSEKESPGPAPNLFVDNPDLSMLPKGRAYISRGADPPQTELEGEFNSLFDLYKERRDLLSEEDRKEIKDLLLRAQDRLQLTPRGGGRSKKRKRKTKAKTKAKAKFVTRKYKTFFDAYDKYQHK